MPGITGIISENNEQYLFDKMMALLNHENYKVEKYVKKDVHFGRIHLNYINKQPQPYISGDRRFAVLLAGEIFSYKEIEEISDPAEFFLEKFLAEGYSCFKYINGQFSAALYDFSEKELILVSDRFSTHPLYYTKTNNKLLFAPEVKALLADPNLEKNINYESVSDLFNFGHLFQNKTMFKNIFQLPEASYLIFKKGKSTINRYWDLPYFEEAYSRQNFSKVEVDNYVEEMQQIILRANERQLKKNRDDILLSLSGGLDSRFVAALVHKTGVNNISSFTMGEPASEDVIYAKIIAKELGMEHQVFQILPENIWENTEYFGYVSDGMSMISGPVQNFEPLRNYKNKSQITLSSQMCDAFFGSTLSRTKLKKVAQKNQWDEESERIVKNIFKIFSASQVKQIFIPEFYEKIEANSSSSAEKYIKEDYHPLHSYFNLLVNEHGRRGTLGGNVVNNLFFESRMPSYDNDVIDFAYKLPVKLKQDQFIYREAFIRMFPELAKIKREGTNLPINVSRSRLQLKILEQKIIGRLKPTPVNKLLKHFSRWNKPSYISYGKWFREDLKQKMESLLLDPETLSRGVFDQKGIKKLLNEHYYTEKDNSPLIWQIINLEYFFRNFID